MYQQTQRRQELFAETAERGRQSRRDALRSRAETYERDGRALLRWTFPDTRPTALAALESPHDAGTTRDLCRALYRDLRTAMALPRHIVGKQMRIDELRILFACECTRYRKQAASVRAQTDMAGFINSLTAA